MIRTRQYALNIVSGLLFLMGLALLITCQGVSSGGSGRRAIVSSHTVSLTWSPSATSNIDGYYIYRSEYMSSCGSYQRLNSSPYKTTSYVDSSVANGASYCYGVSAVKNGQESALSNIVTNLSVPPQ